MAEPDWETGVTGTSGFITLPGGIGALAIKEATSLEAALEVSIDGGQTYQPTGDAFTDNISRKIDQPTECKVRLVVTSGSCDVLMRPPSYNSAGRPS